MIMAVSMEWIRDNYDTDNSRYIEKAEAINALNDRLASKISVAEYEAVQAVYVMHTLLPAPFGMVQAAAKGKIVNFNYPSSSTMNTRIAIRAAVQNTGTRSGTFKLQLFDGVCKIDPVTRLFDSGCKIAQSTQFTVSAGQTSSSKSIYVTLPSGKSSISYQLICARIT